MTRGLWRISRNWGGLPCQQLMKHLELTTLAQVSDGERSLLRMGDHLLVTSSHMREVERERKQQEDKVREITKQLEVNRGRVDQQKVILNFKF